MPPSNYHLSTSWWRCRRGPLAFAASEPRAELMHFVIRIFLVSEYLSSDNDPLYRFHQWQVSLRILGITEIKTIPCVPLSHLFVERVIDTIRREYLDRMLFWTTVELERKLLEFQHYYNGHRTHAGLRGRLPEPSGDRSPIDLGSHRRQKHCRGLYQTPMAA